MVNLYQKHGLQNRKLQEALKPNAATGATLSAPYWIPVNSATHGLQHGPSGNVRFSFSYQDSDIAPWNINGNIIKKNALLKK